MPRYDKVYEILAERAVDSAVLDIQAFIKRAKASGMSDDALTESLLNDFENGGPLFGRFQRNLTGAASSSVRAAERQGQTVGNIRHDPRIRAQIQSDAEASAELLELERLDDVIDGADPEQLERLEELTDNIEVTWIATLRNTCHLCLPLHGITRTRREWALEGLDPDTIHGDWNSECQCKLVPATQTTGRQDLTEPLRRVSLPKEDRTTGRKTARDVSVPNLDRAREAAQKAMESKEGRRILRILGKSGGE
jgi:hypothetical protein